MKPLACACASLAFIIGSNGGAWAQPAPTGEPPPPEGEPPPVPAPSVEPEAQPAQPPPAQPPPAQPGVAPGPAAPPPSYPPYYYPYPYYPPARPPSPPRILPYEEGAPVPAGYHLRETSQRGLVIAGSVTFGSTWLLSAVTAGIIASGGSEEEFTPLFVPLVGPFITLGTADSNTLGSFVLVVDGLAQVMGLGMLVAGVIYPKHEWVLSHARLELTPLVSAETAGFGAKGSF